MRDDHGRRPNVSSVTAKALRAAGFSTGEAQPRTVVTDKHAGYPKAVAEET